MKINLIVFFAVKVGEGKSVRISVITQEGKNSAFFIFQNLFAFAVRNLLLESSHWSKHMLIIAQKGEYVSWNGKAVFHIDNYLCIVYDITYR